MILVCKQSKTNNNKIYSTYAHFVIICAKVVSISLFFIQTQGERGLPKQILYKGSKLSYSYVAAKSIAKRGYGFVSFDNIVSLLSSVDKDSSAVLYFKECVDQGMTTSLLEILTKMSLSQNPVYINKIIKVPLDYRLYCDKTVYDPLALTTIKVDEQALPHCKAAIESVLPFANFQVVEENSLFDNLNDTTAAIANSECANKNVSMSISNLVQTTDQYASFFVLTDSDKFDQNAETVYVSIKAKDLSMDLMSILGVLTMSNVDILSLNSIDEVVIISFKGQVKQKKTIEIFNSLEAIAKEFKILGNI